jgi:hypothetical protein
MIESERKVDTKTVLIEGQTDVQYPNTPLDDDGGKSVMKFCGKHDITL